MRKARTRRPRLTRRPGLTRRPAGGSARASPGPTPLGIVEGFGDDVHLRVDQRTPWDVALAILKALTAPGCRE